MIAPDPSKPVVALILNSQYPGGSELALVETAHGLHNLGYNLQIILPEDGPLTAYLKPYATGLHFVNNNWWASGKPIMSLMRRLWFIKGYYTAAERMVKIFMAENVSIVLTNSVVIPTGAVAAKMAKLKHVWYLHEFGKEDHGFEFWYGQKRSFKLINTLSDHCITNSDAVNNYFGEYVPDQKRSKIYYAIDMAKGVAPTVSQFAPKDRLDCIVTGRVAPGKGQLEAVMAIQQVRAKGINAYLNLQGTADETYKNQILAYMADHELEPYINFLPYNPDPHKAVREADIALVCSRLEAFGRVTVEAMKLGIPVIATSTAGSLEIIGKDQTRGLLYNPGDVTALAACILQYHQSPELRLSLATTAYDWAWQHCNLETHAQQIDAILQNVAYN